MASRPASIRSLKSLIRRYPALDEILFIVSDTPEPIAQSDRTTVIVGTAWLDIFLELVICTRLIGNNEYLFIGTGPLRDTSSRIQVLHALGLITDLIRDELNTIREIRNVFAHTASFITFDTPEVSAACERLWIPHQYPPDDPSYQRDARGKFRLSTRMLWVFLGGQLRNQKRPRADVLLRAVRKELPELFPATLPGISPAQRQTAPRTARRNRRRRGNPPSPSEA